MKQLVFDLVEPPAPTLENFVAGERNAELLQRLRHLAHAPPGERMLYLWGDPGTGRSHLLRGALERLEQHGMRAAYHEACAGLVPERGEMEAVAVDDIQRFDHDSQGALFNLYNQLRENGGIFLAAGDAPPGALRLRADLVTRLAWGLVYEVHALDDEEKVRALTQHAAGRGFDLALEVARYLLNHVQRDMRTLTAMIDALDRYGLQAKRSITVPLLRQMLDDDDMAPAPETPVSTDAEGRS